VLDVEFWIERPSRIVPLWNLTESMRAVTLNTGVGCCAAPEFSAANSRAKGRTPRISITLISLIIFRTRSCTP
jgi:hypothetical protein